MQSCATCRYRSALLGGRIDCLNTAAAPRTLTYAGSGAHPVNFDPANVDGCDDWDLDDVSILALAGSDEATLPSSQA